MLLAYIFYFVNILGESNPYNHPRDINTCELAGKEMMFRTYDFHRISVWELNYYYHYLKPGEFVGGEISPDPEDMAVVKEFADKIGRPLHLLENAWFIEKEKI